jgi:NAD(P)-dependent dehydrogenase (short-subunit alcohol dehydrogenase family)
MKLFDLSNRIAVITGGSKGIGFAIAEGLAAAGAVTVISSSKSENCEHAVEKLKKENYESYAIPANVSDRQSVESLVSEAIKKFGKIDILVNSAGYIVRAPLTEATDEQWNGMMDVNLRGIFYCCQAVGREMIKRKNGNIINISSNISGSLQPMRAIYATTKAGMNHLTKAMALEWAPYGINVNAIAPSSTVTDINKKYFEENPEDRDERIRTIPLGRLGVPEDYIGAALFLASDASDYVTGQILFVDGGSNII